MNQSFPIDMRHQYTSSSYNQRKEMVFLNGLVLPPLYTTTTTPTIANRNSDPAVRIRATPILHGTPPISTLLHESSGSHHHSSTTFLNGHETWDGERIVATSLKRRHDVMSNEIPMHGTKQISLTKPEQPFPQRLTGSKQQPSFPLPLLPCLGIPSLPPLSRTQPSVPQPNCKVVRFAPRATVTIIPSTHDIKTTCWYNRSDYAAFENDCRQSIIAFLQLRSCSNNNQTVSSNTPTTIFTLPQGATATHQPQSHVLQESQLINLELGSNQSMVLSSSSSSSSLQQVTKEPEVIAAQPTKCYFTIHGLDDFTSFEAKAQRSRRRLAHCYNVLLHQWLLQQRRNHSLASITSNPQQQQQRATTTTTTTTTTTISPEQVLQHIAQASSFQSLRLALIRGQSSTATMVH